MALEMRGTFTHLDTDHNIHPISNMWHSDDVRGPSAALCRACTSEQAYPVT
jgi:hypothetical protein